MYKGLQHKIGKADARGITGFSHVQQSVTWSLLYQEALYLRDLCQRLEVIKDTQRSLANRFKNTKIHDQVMGVSYSCYGCI